MADKHTPPKHWFDRFIGILSLMAILGIVVSNNVFQLWVEPPPKWLYIGLAAIATGVTTEEAKEFVMMFLKTWAGKGQIK